MQQRRLHAARGFAKLGMLVPGLCRQTHAAAFFSSQSVFPANLKAEKACTKN
jgi:hypothetical protein